MNKYEELLKEIQKKNELKGIAKKIVSETLHDYIRKNNISLEDCNKKDLKMIVKEIRGQLRNLTGMFSQKSTSKDIALSEYEEENILKEHISTSERMHGYNVLKEYINHGNFSSILDLGCGLNPLIIAKSGITYHAVDIRQDYLDTVMDFFRSKNIKGTIEICDIRHFLPSVTHADLVLMLKLLDVIDKKGHKRAEQLIRALTCREMLISFSTKTLSGKPMNHPQRGWIERLLKRLGYTYESFSLYNEIFYRAFKS